MPDPTPKDLERAREAIGFCSDQGDPQHAASCPLCLSRDQMVGDVAQLIADQRERDARMADSPCGLDADPKGMTCERRRPGGKVYHDPRCRRQDAEDIRSGDA